MNKINVAILGAGGIGKFHAREFYSLGCNILAILGTSQESAKKSAETLLTNFGIKATPHWNIDSLLSEKIDVASICTPLQTHYFLTKKCLERKVHVLCEKPFVVDTDQAEELFNLSKKVGKKLAVNTQWPTVLEFLKYDKDISSLEIRMDSGVKGIKILEEYIPHQNSLLIKLCGIRTAKNIRFAKKNEESLEIDFEYVTNFKVCKVKYLMDFKEERPRSISFKINKKEFARNVIQNYQQQIISEGKEVYSGDPLNLSIKNFIEAISSRKKLFFTQKEILTNILLYNDIVKKYKIRN